jgi:antitoxin component of MazEF toxin-antitoxin module
MTSTIVQILLSVIAGGAVFFMWKRVAASSRAVAWLVTAGMLIRAVGGQVVFWISYLHLPVARSLQLGDGFWIFGLDAMTYFQQSTDLAHSGPAGILFANPAFGSVFYVQTLATAILLFGAIASTALLLNIAAYLGCCLVALSFGDPAKHRAVVFTIAVLSLAPSTVMWSLQPMKDTWFIFLVAAFFGAARLWQQAWSGPNATSRRIIWTLVMIATLYGISGIRWYFGVIAAIASLPFFVLTILRTSPHAVGVAAALGLGPLLFAAVIIGSGPSIEPILRAVGHPEGSRALALPRALLKRLHDARAGFESTGGATIIGAGHAISAVDSQLGNHEVRVSPVRIDPRTLAPPPPDQPSVTSGKPESKPVRTSESTSTIAAVPRRVIARPVIARRRPIPPEVVAPVEVEGGTSSGTVLMPASHVARFLAGSAAMILPRTVAQRLGILDVRGGRGLWLFVELDTLVFDVVFAFCLATLIGAVRRRDLRAPVFWLILMVTVVVGVLLAYTVSNFGTLFRHREMVLLGLLLLPLAVLPAESPARVPEDVRDVVGGVADALGGT